MASITLTIADQYLNSFKDALGRIFVMQVYKVTEDSTTFANSDIIQIFPNHGEGTLFAISDASNHASVTPITNMDPFNENAVYLVSNGGRVEFARTAELGNAFVITRCYKSGSLYVFSLGCIIATADDNHFLAQQTAIPAYHPPGSSGDRMITAWVQPTADDLGYATWENNSTGNEWKCQVSLGKALADELYKNQYILFPDPYANAGESEPGGMGDGNFDFSSTVIPIPGLPNIGATDTGFISLYKPSAAQLKSLANYMWAGAFDITQFKKLFADPMDAILGLHIIPTTSSHPTSGSASLVVGNIDTGLTMPTCLEQYYEADMGEITVPAKWGAYLDYSPYTKLSLFLPYIGFVPLSPDDCMRGSIKVVYHVDVLSGTCMAFVYCVSNRGQDGHTLYMFNGSCSCDCPVTSGQYRSALEGLLGIAGSIGRVAAGDVAGGIKDAISNVTSMVKPEIGRSGSFGGSGGLMGIQYPYLVLTVPRMCIPGQQNTYVGYPSYVTKTIGDLTGFTSIDVTHLNNMTCTQAETDEIISLLSEGVIL